MDIVRRLADSIVDEAERKAEDAATIEFLQGRVKRLEDALVATRTACGKEHSQHMGTTCRRRDVEVRASWARPSRTCTVKFGRARRAADNAKAWYTNDEAKEAERVAQEKEYEEEHREEVRRAPRHGARGRCDQACAGRGQPQAQAQWRPRAHPRGRRGGRRRERGAGAQERQDRQYRQARVQEGGRVGQGLRLRTRTRPPPPAAPAPRLPPRLLPRLPPPPRCRRGAAQGRQGGGDVPWPQGGGAGGGVPAKKPTPTIAKKPAAAKSAAAKPAAASAKPPKGQRKAKTGYHLWMGAQSTKTLFVEAAQEGSCRPQGGRGATRPVQAPAEVVPQDVGKGCRR